MANSVADIRLQISALHTKLDEVLAKLSKLDIIETKLNQLDITVVSLDKRVSTMET